MAKKILCIVLSIAMLLGTFALAASASGKYYSYTLDEAQEEFAEKLWEVEYDASDDYKDMINRRFLTGVKASNYDNWPATAAPEEILQQNLYFWADEIVDAYNSASTNEEYWELYNKMCTPQIVEYPYDGGVDADILYDYGYKYRDQSKAVMELDIVANTEYAKAGDIITVDVYAKSNFRTSWMTGGIFYDKQYLTPVSIEFDAEANPTWYEKQQQLELAVTYNDDGSVKSDNRHRLWPDSMISEENYDKYGVSYIFVEGDKTLITGNFLYGKQFDGSRLFTATYEVKEDVPEGTELEFFVVDDSTISMADLLREETDMKKNIFTFHQVVYDGMTAATQDITTDANALYDQKVVSDGDVVIVGEEPAPAVKGEIVNVSSVETYIGNTTMVYVDVTGSPESLKVETPDGFITFTREDALLIEATDEGEKWYIDIFVNAETVDCTVYANYGELGSTDGIDFTLTGLVKQDLAIHSIEIPDMYPDAQNGGVITAGKHDIIIKTSTDVTKIQFYDPADGTTYTYTSWSGAGKVPYEDVDGERIWTINHAFGPFGTRSLVIRTRSATTFFARTTSTLDATVVY